MEGEFDDEEVVLEGKLDTDMDVDGIFKFLVEDGDVMVVDFEKGDVLFNGGGGGGVEEEEIDFLDVFMNSMILFEVEKLISGVVVLENIIMLDVKDKKDDRSNGEMFKKDLKKYFGRIMFDEDFDVDDEDFENDGINLEDEDDDEFMKRVKKIKVERLVIVDYLKIDYIDFRKNFYMEVKEIVRMILEDVIVYRKELELKVYGKDVSKLIKIWY